MTPEHTTIGQAANGRWWAKCTRPACNHYTSALRTREEALRVAAVHQLHHRRRGQRKARRNPGPNSTTCTTVAFGAGQPVENPMTSATFDPTADTSGLGVWLSLADRLQLQRDLADLPALAELLDRHYFDFLARGDRNPDDSSVRYVTRFDVLDLADRRTKWEHSATRTEPLTLADRRIAGPNVDPAWWADLARRMGARRQGILPTLGSWVSLASGEMHDAGEWHTPPADPDLAVWVVAADGTTHLSKPGPTVASEAGWLHRHLEWILGQQWVIELADEVRQIVLDLEALGVGIEGPDHRATGTVSELAEHLDIPQQTIRDWIRKGWLHPIKADRPAVYVRHEIVSLRTTRV